MSFLAATGVQGLADRIIVEAFGAEPATWAYTELVYVGLMFACAFLAINFGAILAGIFSWAERRIAARMQSRIGPNRVGPAGFLQWVADALKLLQKEDIIPYEADQFLFRAAPYFMMVGFACTFIVLPFGYGIVVADMNLGLFFLISITALVVVGVLMSGWGSNSKWSLFGAMRSAAQIVSYEIPAGLALMMPILIAGTLSMQGLIEAQAGAATEAVIMRGGWPWNWAIFHDPMTFCAFFVFFTAALAEGNRTPFDLPEAESELVAGYFTEYTGMRFSFFFLVEWGNIWVMSAFATTVFLGGWLIPGVHPAAMSAATGWTYFTYTALSLMIFFGKTLFLCFVVMWIRWTLPRIRVDQMMNLCWKYFVPTMMAGVILVAAWMLFLPASIQRYFGIPMFLATGLVPAVLFVMRTRENITVSGDKVSMENW